MRTRGDASLKQPPASASHKSPIQRRLAARSPHRRNRQCATSRHRRPPAAPRRCWCRWRSSGGNDRPRGRRGKHVGKQPVGRERSFDDRRPLARRSARGRSPSSSPDRTTRPRGALACRLAADPVMPALRERPRALLHRRRQQNRRLPARPESLAGEVLGTPSPTSVANSRPPMKRADGTGSPNALTLTSVSRAGSSCDRFAADRHRR